MTFKDLDLHGGFAMKRLCDFYIRRAGWIGVAYCAVPALAWFLFAVLFVPFRTVYLLRLGLSLLVGCAAGAYLNRYGVDIWLCKHRGADGPATVMDGALVGASIGIGTALLPTLSILISSSNMETAKTTIVITYLAAAFVGAVFGAVLARIAQEYVPRGGSDKSEMPGESQR
jgi:hypothetical protein